MSLRFAKAGFRIMKGKKNEGNSRKVIWAFSQWAVNKYNYSLNIKAVLKVLLVFKYNITTLLRRALKGVPSFSKFCLNKINYKLNIS